LQDYGMIYSITTSVGDNSLYFESLEDKAEDWNAVQQTLSQIPLNQLHVHEPIYPNIVYNGKPTGSWPSDTTSLDLTVDTTVNATCAYATTANNSSKTDMSTTGGTSHSETLTGLTADTTYNYYVSCNGSQEIHIQFSILGDDPPISVPPVMSNILPQGEQASGTTSVNMTLDTDVSAICKYSLTDVSFSNMTNIFATVPGISHSQTIGSLSDGDTKIYYIRCQNMTTNDVNLSSAVSSFFIAQASGTPDMVSPVSGSTLTGTSQLFTWEDNGATVTDYELLIGSTVGGSNYWNGTSLGVVLTETVTGLPNTGVPLYVRLRYNEGGWVNLDFIYNSFNANPPSTPSWGFSAGGEFSLGFE
jgi:hypothetical protein